MKLPRPSDLSAADTAARYSMNAFPYSKGSTFARAGQDYESQSGTLVFRTGEDSKRRWVPIQFDREDEETETMTLRLSNASGAQIRRGAATGSIEDYSSRR